MEQSTYIPPKEVLGALASRLEDAPSGTLLLIPREVHEGTAIYHDSHVATVKELRAEGFEAAFLASHEERGFVSEFSHSIIYDLAIGVAGGLSVELIRALWQYVRSQSRGLSKPGAVPHVRLHVAKIRDGDREVNGVTLEGPATEETPEALLELLLRRDDDD